jgi:hypothetical protein
MSTEFQSAAISEELRAAVISEEFRQKESKHNIQQKGAQDQRHRVHAELGLLRRPLPGAFEEKVKR